MQRLPAPTRYEVDHTHAQHVWLDAGFPSARNLRLPLHLFYNSTVFLPLTASAYQLLTADRSFMGGAPLNALAAFGTSSVNAFGEVTRELECLRADALLDFFRFTVKRNKADQAWVCGNTIQADSGRICTKALALRMDRWIVRNHEIAYCLSRRIEARCQLQFSVPILALVIACNAVKLICMLLILWLIRKPSTVTLGDIIGQFLDRPDDTTKNMSLGGEQRGTIQDLWQVGFGAVAAEFIVRGVSVSGILGNTILANMPQLILSLLCLAYNGIFTCDLVAREGDSRGRKESERASLSRASRSCYDVQQKEDLVHCVYSPIVIVISVTVAPVMVLVGLAVGFLRYHSSIPLVGSCNAAISAECHPDSKEYSSAPLSLQPLQWGVTSRDADKMKAHCAFSAEEVEEPNEDTSI
ncbi:MAG: hypothetical protein M1832_003264 [Thelocarpon impressellum]|nr:MAG: hypothetical protein M1832_003264 [Thelocarpon impressellum]